MTEVKTDGKAVKTTPRATHMGELKIGDINISCCVLNDQKRTRVLSGRAVTGALGLTGRGQGIARFLGSKSLKPFISNELTLAINNPLEFLWGGLSSFGYEATILPALCDAILDAKDAEALTPQQAALAIQARILSRAFSKVGIIALVDEATGFQDDRARDALAKILEAFVAKELQKWVKTFPPEFYKEMFRLRRLPYPPNTVKKAKYPQYIGHLTNDNTTHLGT